MEDEDPVRAVATWFLAALQFVSIVLSFLILMNMQTENTRGIPHSMCVELTPGELAPATQP